MNILILGNGFDLAHGLPTAYKDFLNYCQNNKKYEKFCLSNIWMKHFITRQSELGDNWIDIEKEIYEVIKSFQKLPIVRFAKTNRKSQYCILSLPLYNIEFNLFNLQNYLEETKTNLPCSKEGTFFSHFSKNYMNYLITDYIDLIKLLYKHLREFTKTFEQYLKEDLYSNIDKPIKYKFNINTECISLLNFNYTDTCEKIYNVNFNNCGCGIRTQSVYIHGKINNDDNCNLVLGTHSFFNYLPNNLNEEIPAEFNVFRKHNQRHRYDTIKAYQDLLHELKYPKKIYTAVFYIVGHSLDKTDHNIIKHILLAKEKSIIKIYYHNEEAQEKLINNITEIIGEGEVMSKVQLIYQHDPKRGILLPQEKTIG